jgi:hypothetical protein
MANEHPDAEMALYKELANIKELKKEVRSLKKQLNRLDKRITAISAESIGIEQEEYRHFFLVLLEMAFRNLHDKGHVLPQPSTLRQTSQTCKATLWGYYLEARQQIIHFNDTDEMNVFQSDFIKKINDALKHHGFSPITREASQK